MKNTSLASAEIGSNAPNVSSGSKNVVNLKSALAAWVLWVSSTLGHADPITFEQLTSQNVLWSAEGTGNLLEWWPITGYIALYDGSYIFANGEMKPISNLPQIGVPQTTSNNSPLEDNIMDVIYEITIDDETKWFWLNFKYFDPANYAIYDKDGNGANVWYSLNGWPWSVTSWEGWKLTEINAPTSSVPEPGTFGLAGVAALGAAAATRRRRQEKV